MKRTLTCIMYILYFTASLFGVYTTAASLTYEPGRAYHYAVSNSDNGSQSSFAIVLYSIARGIEWMQMYVPDRNEIRQSDMVGITGPTKDDVVSTRQMYLISHVKRGEVLCNVFAPYEVRCEYISSLYRIKIGRIYSAVTSKHNVNHIMSTKFNVLQAGIWPHIVLGWHLCMSASYMVYVFYMLIVWIIGRVYRRDARRKCDSNDRGNVSSVEVCEMSILMTMYKATLVVGMVLLCVHLYIEAVFLNPQRVWLIMMFGVFFIFMICGFACVSHGYTGRNGVVSYLAICVSVLAWYCMNMACFIGVCYISALNVVGCILIAGAICTLFSIAIYKMRSAKFKMGHISYLLCVITVYAVNELYYRIARMILIKYS